MNSSFLLDKGDKANESLPFGYSPPTRNFYRAGIGSTSILENLEFREVEMRFRTLGQAEKLELNRLGMLDCLDDW